ncbi:MAG: hypothetical protein KC441_01630 [Anaerolineales bacterium]|nr:hypothetical protein [Anaerolineales bacterium]
MQSQTGSQAIAYKTELNRRYWAYQELHFPAWEKFFDQPRTEGIRPPVFRREVAWRNVIVSPEATSQEIQSVLALVPAGEQHKWFRSMNSSQALAQSVFGNLAVYGLLHHLAELQSDEGEPLFGETQVSSANFQMEFKVNHLGEPRSTSLDGYISGDYRVAIECKFTEIEFGVCSRPRLTPRDSKYELEHCNGSYSRQGTRLERCPLSSIGVLYWRYIPLLFKWQSDKDLLPCPLNKNYQLVRNVLAIGAKADGAVSVDDGHVLVIYDERNPAFQEEGSALAAYIETQAALRKPTMLRKCSWQRITEHIRSCGSLPWLTEHLALKYGM